MNGLGRSSEYMPAHEVPDLNVHCRYPWSRIYVDVAVGYVFEKQLPAT